MRIESGYLKQDRLCGQKNNRNAVGNFSDAMNKVRESISNKVSTRDSYVNGMDYNNFGIYTKNSISQDVELPIETERYKIEDATYVNGVAAYEIVDKQAGKDFYIREDQLAIQRDETFGGRDTIINNLMKQFDSEGDLLNANGVAGMDVTGKGTSWQQLTSVSEEYRQKMFDNVKREFIQENGLSNGDTTKRSDIFKDYQLSVSKDKRLSGTWTLEQYEGQYRAAMYAAVKSANPNWKPGQKFDTSILDNVTRESVESTLVKNGNRLVRNSIDVSV